ncbi:hypothetical protein [Halosimplex pelagicum]|uniref:DUF5658 domain-containing protein n=1 Tax=Halosimplex pelagicum TaxID=869886 RepID=A0A7D5TQA9_9EURY|nr:hypothetical protein [Halosimplex pelagicum]QLH80352.1 hypothetical protein HZS54_01335 [Halosimplex pelagicum]
MAWTVSLPRLDSPSVGSSECWLVGVLFFGLGDLATTWVGLGAGLAERNPVAVALLGRYGLLALVVPKLLVLGGAYLVWRRMSRPARAGIPVGLAVLGVSVTGWNLWMLTTAIGP